MFFGNFFYLSISKLLETYRVKGKKNGDCISLFTKLNVAEFLTANI